MCIRDRISIDDEVKPAVYVLSDESWHQGVVGLVASRIKERTKRPVIAMALGDNEGEWKGSARSVEGVHMRDLFARLDSLYPGLMSKFGGHAMAAGFSLEQRNKAKFDVALAEVAEKFTEGHDWSHVLWTDGQLQVDEFNMELAEQLRQSTPWGQGFPEPLFDGEFEVLEARIVGETHAKLRLKPVEGTISLDAICFGYLDSCLLYTSPSPRDLSTSRMPSSA